MIGQRFLGATGEYLSLEGFRRKHAVRDDDGTD